MPDSERRSVTYAEIADARDAPGGWTKDTLARLWSVPWPPPALWRDQLIKHGVPYLPTTDGSDDYQQSPFRTPAR